MARANVPQFGNWDTEGSVPYTVYFDNARKNRGGKMMNPNEPQENPEMFNKNKPPSAPRFGNRPEEPIKQGSSGNRTNKDDLGEFKQFKNSPARNGSQVPSYGGRGQRPVRSSKPNAGSEHRFEKSPLHPQAKITGRGSVFGSSSPAWDGKSQVDSLSAHGTPGRSRLRPTTPAQGDESPDKCTAVPRFGEWDENDPQSAEEFTHIFDEVRNERNTGTGNASATPRHRSFETRTQQPKDPKKCCFPWW